MLKLSFKIQLAIIIITLVGVVFVAVHFIREANQQTQFAQRRAQQAADLGFQAITESAVHLSEDGVVFLLNSLKNISGETEDGGKYSVVVSKDTISIDSIEIKIESRGSFGDEIHSQSRRMLFVSPDSVNWVIAD